jgi:hypothetical protein
MMTGASDGGRLVELHVGAADAGDLHLQQRAVDRDLGHREFADLGPARARANRGQHLFHGLHPRSRAARFF